MAGWLQFLPQIAKAVAGGGGGGLTGNKGTNPSAAGGNNTFSNILSMFGSAKGGGGGISVPSSGSQGFTTNFLSPSQLQQQNQLNNINPGGGSGGPGGGGGGGGFLSNLFSGVLDNFGQVAGGVSSLFKDPKSTLGAGLLGVGLGKSMPKVPDLPQSVTDLRSRVEAGGGPLRQQATGSLSQMLNQQYEPLSEPEIQAALRQLELEQKQEEDKVRDLYRNIRPGTDPSSDSAFRRDLAEVNDRFAKAKADQLATRTRDTKSIFDQQRFAQIQQALGADDQTMNQLAQLAQLDINQIMAQLQIDYASAVNFKQTFQSLGGQLLLSGTNSSSPFSNFQSA